VITGLRQRRHAASARLFDDGIVCARVRKWPSRPDIAHLVLTDHTVAPSQGSLDEWTNSLRAEGYGSIRTGALSQSAAAPFELAGFHEVQQLALLRMKTPIALLSTRAGRRPHHEMRPLRSQRALDVAARLDHLAFDSGWDLDVAGIEEACHATPVHRIRLAVTATDEPVGYMVTGRNGSAGFIQRLAVDPAHEGQGVATSLLQDGFGWLARRRVTDILVNTHLDNERALTLYQRLGFEQLPENLRVMELSLGSPLSESGVS
jgi:ribosomal protein S18 acetylase RimI-like enzyme